MGFDYKAYEGYLNEAQAELLRIGAVKCNRLRDETQLSATIYLLIRATSLFYSVLSTPANGRLDLFDVVRRSHLEAWLLAFEFRLEESQSKAARWHAEKNKFGSPNIKVIEHYVRSQGIIDKPLLGQDYGRMCTVIHPTRFASENSVAVVCSAHDTVARHSLLNAKADYECGDVPRTMPAFYG